MLTDHHDGAAQTAQDGTEERVDLVDLVTPLDRVLVGLVELLVDGLELRVHRLQLLVGGLDVELRVLELALGLPDPVGQPVTLGHVAEGDHGADAAFRQGQHVHVEEADLTRRPCHSSARNEVASPISWPRAIARRRSAGR